MSKPRGRTRSIRLRLWSAAAVSILIALTIAGIGLRELFEWHVERQIEDDLAVDLNQIVAATSFAADKSVQVGPALTDPRFDAPLSGYYWQVENEGTGMLVRSRSLWDGALTLPAPGDDGTLHVQEIESAEGGLLISVDRTIVDAGGQSFRVAVAEDHGSVTAAVRDYIVQLAPALALLGGVLAAAIFIQITVGLAPLETLRNAVREVVARRSARLAVAAPREVQPLAEEINRLLDAQEKALARARSRAADLAHGLKTPLQVLFADIRTLREKGETALADEMAASATAIRRHVERELARARLAPGLADHPQCRVADAVAGVVGVVKRTPEGERLAFSIDIADGLMAPADEGDLSEILGNLTENAARFARSTIRVGGQQTAAGTEISVADDGPGLSDADKQSVLGRGVTTKDDGGGLGLAIVADIVEAYDGSLAMSDAAPGLKVTIVLPQRLQGVV
jgi:signal transduction histidine kinase